MVTAVEFQKSEIDSIILQSVKKTLSDICHHLSERNPKYNWTGVYVVVGDNLKLVSFQGAATEHVLIPLGEGLCSLAISRNETVNEKDVKSNSEYLACFLNTKAELVVPVRYGDKPIGEIDIDSDEKGAFDRDDEKFVEEIAEKISPLVKLIYDQNEKNPR